MAFAAVVLAWAGLELMRYRAEHRTIPVIVMIYGPPTGPMAAQFAAAGITNIGMPVAYDQVTNPPVSRRDLAAIQRCLARDRLLPLFPLEIEITGEEVEARYKAKMKRRTNGFHETVIQFARNGEDWQIVGIHDRRGTGCPARPWQWWEKLLDFVPFVD
jgi:hypothetical protein